MLLGAGVQCWGGGVLRIYNLIRCRWSSLSRSLRVRQRDRLKTKIVCNTIPGEGEKFLFQKEENLSMEGKLFDRIYCF